MSSELLQEEELHKWAGTGQRLKLQSWLQEQRIPYTLNAKKKVVTTITAINRALIGDTPVLVPITDV